MKEIVWEKLRFLKINYRERKLREVSKILRLEKVVCLLVGGCFLLCGGCWVGWHENCLVVWLAGCVWCDQTWYEFFATLKQRGLKGV